MFSHPKQLAFAPLYLRQALRVKRDTPSLPEAVGNRQGVLRFVSNKIVADKGQPLSLATDTNELADNSLSTDNITQHTDNNHKTAYRLMIVGDSSAAGVGVDYQSQALMGRLLLTLCKNDAFTDRYTAIDWQLDATSGHTSFDALRRLYVLPAPAQPLDVMVVVVGVNDITRPITNAQLMASWHKNINEIISIGKQKFQAKDIIFSALPPVTQFPALPYPLNEFIGNKAIRVNQALAEICHEYEYDYVHYADFTLPFDPNVYSANFITDQRQKIAQYFASDGFHPGALAYQMWGEQLAKLVADLH